MRGDGLIEGAALFVLRKAPAVANMSRELATEIPVEHAVAEAGEEVSGQFCEAIAAGKAAKRAPEVDWLGSE